MEKDYCARREEGLAKRLDELGSILVLITILFTISLVLQSNHIIDLEGQLNNCINSTNPCSHCSLKEVFYVNMTDLNESNPPTYQRDVNRDFIQSGSLYPPVIYQIQDKRRVKENE